MMPSVYSNLFVSSSAKKLRLFLGIMLNRRVSMTHPTDGKEINDSFLAARSWRIRIMPAFGLDL